MNTGNYSHYLFVTLPFLLFFSYSGHSATAVSKSSPTVKKIVILGDSLTEGYGVAKAQAYPALIEAALKSDGFKVQIVNAGISGSTTATGPARIKWILKSKPDIVFIALGANDGLRGVDLAVTKKNLKETIQLAKQNQVKVWLAKMQMPPNYGTEYTKKFSDLFIDIAKDEKIPLSPFLLDGVAGQSRYNQSDAIHPNEDGHRIIANKLLSFFKDNI